MISLEHHVKQHHDRSRSWSAVCLNIAALIFFVTLVLSSVVDLWPTHLILEAAAYLVVIASAFLIMCDFLYKSLANDFVSTVSEEPATLVVPSPGARLETIGRLAGGFSSSTAFE